MASRVLVYSRTKMSDEPRVARQIACLGDEYRIVAAGLAPPSGAVEAFVDLSRARGAGMGRGLAGLIRHFAGYGPLRGPCLALYWALLKVPALEGMKLAIELLVINRDTIRRLRKRKYRLAIANDPNSLSVCFAARPDSVLYDAHEYAPGQYPRTPGTLAARRYVDFILRRYMPRCARIATVCEPIAALYAERYGIERPTVVTNAPRYQDLAPTRRDDGIVRLVHHGAALPGRAIETLIRAMELLDGGYSLDFFLKASDTEYFRRLERAAGSDGRIRFNDPVAMPELPRILNGYDIGVYSLAPSSLNNRLALPNKLFEFAQARIAVAIGPSPAMAEYVEAYGLGVVADDFSAEALASAIRSIDPIRLRAFKDNAHKHARELSAEPQLRVLSRLISEAAGA